MARMRSLAWELWLAVALIALWWFASAGSQSTFFPPLSEILQTFREDWLFGRFFSDFVPSIANLLSGLAIAVVLGVAVGLALGSSRYLWMALGPLANFMRALPTLALVPAAMAIFGIGAEQKVLLIAFASFWPVLLGTIDGVRAVDFTLRDVSRSYQLPTLKQVFFVTLPSASPNILAGVRISLAIGVIMMVGSELYGASQGIGFYLIQAQRQYQLPEVWAATILLGIVGYLLSLAFRLVEHRLLHWHPSSRNRQPTRSSS